MLRKPWDIYESALLLDTLILIESGLKTRKNGIEELSYSLRALGKSRGLFIDEKYSNTNGISMRLSGMQYAWTDGTKGWDGRAKIFYEIVDIYRHNPAEYQRILSEAKAMTTTNTVADQFCSWLAERVSPAKLSELYYMYTLIDDFCMSRKITDRPLLSIVDLKTVKKVFNIVEQNKVFRFMHRGQTIRISAAARYYLTFITENGASPAINSANFKTPATIVTDAAKPTTVVAEIIKAHIDYVDNRDKQGCLWIWGGSELQAFVNKCAKNGVVFHYSKMGCLASRNTIAWWTTDEYDNTKNSNLNSSDEILNSNRTQNDIASIHQPVVAQERELELSHTKVVDFNESADYTNTVPVSYSYFGELFSVSSWQDVYCKVLKSLYDDYDLTKLKGKTTNNGKRMLWGNKYQTSRMKRPFAINKGELYADIGFENNAIVKLISTLLEFCRVDYENVVISYNDSKPKHIAENEATMAAVSKQVDVSEPTVENKQVDAIKCNKTLFFDWLKENPATKSSHLAIYLSVRQIEKFIETSAHTASSLYELDMLNDVVDLSYQLMADDSFLKLDKYNRGALAEALQIYVDFAKEHLPTGAQKNNPETENKTENIQKTTNGLKDQYSTILETNFPDGFRPNKAIDRNRFRMYFAEEYSEELKDSDDQIVNQLLKIGTLRNNRIFIKDEAEQKDLIMEIEDTIIQTFGNGASCIYIDCLYNRFHSELSESLHIYDVEAFENVLLGRCNRRYYKRYNYLCNLGSVANPQRDVLSYMKRHHVPVTYDEIANDIWYIPLDKIKQILVTAIETVNAAPEAYMYAPNLPINEDELKTITAHVHSALLQRSYISDVELMQIIKDNCPSVAMNTSEYPVWGLRNVFSYLLRKEFSFRGGIISRKGEEISMTEVFSDFCKRNERLTVDELKSFAGELETVIYWEPVYAEMIRINHSEFIRKDQLSFDVDRIDAVLDMLISDEYVPLKSINLFLHFPPLCIGWNSFVLESYVANYSNKYRLLHAGFAAADCYGAIVKRDSGILDYRSLLVDVLANNRTWKSKADALEILVRDSYQQRRSYSDIEKVMQEARAKADTQKSNNT